MAFVTFTTGRNPNPQRVAVNPAHVVAVTPNGDHASIWMSVSAGNGYLVYNVLENFDDVLAQLDGA